MLKKKGKQPALPVTTTEPKSEPKASSVERGTRTRAAALRTVMTQSS